MKALLEVIVLVCLKEVKKKIKIEKKYRQSLEVEC